MSHDDVPARPDQPERPQRPHRQVDVLVATVAAWVWVAATAGPWDDPAWATPLGLALLAWLAYRVVRALIAYRAAARAPR